jgi:membrane-associated phospholipid phosphatase
MATTVAHPRRPGALPDALGAWRSAWTWRQSAFAAAVLLYLALVALVIVGSPLDDLDQQIVALDLRGRWPGWHRFVLDYVMFGQRGPSTLAALPLIVWVARRRRSFAPFVMLGTALVLLNLSVGVIKVATGRYGPLVTAHAHEVLAGGNIFPSGHTANAVVLYGVLAMMATRHRKAMTVLAVWISLTVGLSTLYLDTHWLTDVVGGWLAGAIVLMMLPRCLPVAERLIGAGAEWLRRINEPERRYRPQHWRASDDPSARQVLRTLP